MFGDMIVFQVIKKLMLLLAAETVYLQCLHLNFVSNVVFTEAKMCQNDAYRFLFRYKLFGLRSICRLSIFTQVVHAADFTPSKSHELILSKKWGEVET